MHIQIKKLLTRPDRINMTDRLTNQQTNMRVHKINYTSNEASKLDRKTMQKGRDGDVFSSNFEFPPKFCCEFLFVPET